MVGYRPSSNISQLERGLIILVLVEVERKFLSLVCSLWPISSKPLVLQAIRFEGWDLINRSYLRQPKDYLRLWLVSTSFTGRMR